MDGEAPVCPKWMGRHWLRLIMRLGLAIRQHVDLGLKAISHQRLYKASRLYDPEHNLLEFWENQTFVFSASVINHGATPHVGDKTRWHIHNIHNSSSPCFTSPPHFAQTCGKEHILPKYRGHVAVYQHSCAEFLANVFKVFENQKPSVLFCIIYFIPS